MAEADRLLAALPQAIIVTDLAGNITFWNPGAERLFGWPAEEVLGRSISTVTVADPAIAQAAEIMEKLRAGERWYGAFRVRRRDGSSFVAIVCDTPLFDDDGSITGVLGVSMPLEQFDLPQLRAESESLYRDIVDSAQEGIMMTDADGRIVYVNERFGEMIGIPSASALGRVIDDFLPEDEKPRIREKMLRRREGISEQYELRLRRADGTWIWVLIEARPLLDTHGNYRGARASLIDITARKESELRLRDREQQLQEAQKIARMSCWELDLRTRVCRLDESAGGRLPQQLSLDEMLELIHPLDRARVVEELAECELTRNAFDVEYRIRLTDGKYRVVHSRGEVICDENGTPLRISGVVQNITDRKRLEERLQQAERISSIGRLAASVAHEFNNILMGIQPFAELITRSGEAETVTGAASQIIRSVGRGKRITQDILRFTRIADPNLRTYEVAAWLQRITPELRQLAGPRVKLEVRSERIAMCADAEQLQQVLANLVVNASDAMPSGGELFITASGADEWVQIAVRDTGIGMSARTLEMIFEPLFTTKKSGGNGLGLAIAFQLMQRQHGDIVAESEEGRGTTFHLRIPRSHESPAELAAQLDAPRATQWPFARMTLIEDDEVIAEGLVAMLQLDGVAVDVVTTAAAAIAGIERHHPQAVILDVGLPDASGVDVYREIAKRWPDLPVLFSTGHGDERLLADLLTSPNVACLQKPYDTDVLLAELRKLRHAKESGTPIKLCAS